MHIETAVQGLPGAETPPSTTCQSTGPCPGTKPESDPGSNLESWRIVLQLVAGIATHSGKSSAQIVCIQESHWGDKVAPSFITAQWSVYTSPSTDNKAAGLVVLIDRRSLPHGEVLTADPKPGRIQHLRLAMCSWTLDLLHVYQKPYNFHPKASQDAKTIRAEVWQELETQIRRIPKRHTLLVLGDYNCPLKSCPTAGTRVCLEGGKMPPDQGRLQTLVEELGLVHLNSWCKEARGTFVHAKGTSLTDHVLMRAAQTDKRAKQSKPIDLGIAAWRLGGKHLPVFASVAVTTFHSLNQAPGPSQSLEPLGSGAGMSQSR